MNNFQEFIKPELLILIPVLYLIGAGIKRSKIRDHFIPAILGVAGVILSGMYILAIEQPFADITNVFSAIFSAITQGILCAGASVYVNQIFKQAEKDD